MIKKSRPLCSNDEAQRSPLRCRGQPTGPNPCGQHRFAAVVGGTAYEYAALVQTVTHDLFAPSNIYRGSSRASTSDAALSQAASEMSALNHALSRYVPSAKKILSTNWRLMVEREQETPRWARKCMPRGQPVPTNQYQHTVERTPC